MKKVAFVNGLVFVHDNLNETVDPCHEARGAVVKGVEHFSTIV